MGAISFLTFIVEREGKRSNLALASLVSLQSTLKLFSLWKELGSYKSEGVDVYAYVSVCVCDSCNPVIHEVK